MTTGIVGSQKDLYALVRTSRRLYTKHIFHLHTHDVTHGNSSGLAPAARTAPETVVVRFPTAGADVTVS